MFQLLVEACDNGNPQLCKNTTVTITIDRVGVFPVCQYPQGGISFINTILETAPLGSTVLDIDAQDTDVKVSRGSGFENLPRRKKKRSRGLCVCVCVCVGVGMCV